METESSIENNVSLKHRVAVLVQQLTALQQQDTSLEKLLPVTELLLAELQGGKINSDLEIIQTKYVTIVPPPYFVPASKREDAVVLNAEETVSSATVKQQVQKEVDGAIVETLLPIHEETISIVSEELPKQEIKDEEVIGSAQPQQIEESIPQEEKIETIAPSEEVPIELDAKEDIVSIAPEPIESKKEEPKQFNLWESVPNDEIPTLSHQKTAPSNIAQSINESLAQQSKEPKKADDGFSKEPIKDLKKAISINDRFLFINELFRGDESTYERSIKTINGFRIRQEAEFWIQRELLVKMGWDDKSPVVRQFLNLVERRFL